MGWTVVIDEMLRRLVVLVERPERPARTDGKEWAVRAGNRRDGT